MDVSIILLCYNLDNYIHEAIESLLNQDYKGSFEIILINDASSDNSDKIIKKFNDDRIIYIKNEFNLGASESINLAFKLCRGNYICRFDGDDRWYKNYLSTVMDVFIKNPFVEFIHTDMSTIDKYGNVTKFNKNINRPLTLSIFDFEFLHLFENYYANAPTIIAKRELWLDCLPWPEWGRFGLGDMYVTLKMLKSRKSYFVNQPLAFYRVHNSNMHRDMIKNGHAEKNLEFIFDFFNPSKYIRAINYYKLGLQYFANYDIESTNRMFKKVILSYPLLIFKSKISIYILASIIGKKRYEYFKKIFSS